MSKRYTSRYNGSISLNGTRDTVEHAREKEPEAYRSRTHHRPSVSESINGSLMTCCNEPCCVCVCPECKEPSVTGVRHDVCELVHERRVEREQQESFALTDAALMQLRIAGLL